MCVGIMIAKMIIFLLAVAFTFRTLFCASMGSDFAVMITLMCLLILLNHYLAVLSFILGNEVLIREAIRGSGTLP